MIHPNELISFRKKFWAREFNEALLSVWVVAEAIEKEITPSTPLNVNNKRQRRTHKSRTKFHECQIRNWKGKNYKIYTEFSIKTKWKGNIYIVLLFLYDEKEEEDKMRD